MECPHIGQKTYLNASTIYQAAREVCQACQIGEKREMLTCSPLLMH